MSNFISDIINKEIDNSVTREGKKVDSQQYLSNMIRHGLDLNLQIPAYDMMDDLRQLGVNNYSTLRSVADIQGSLIGKYGGSIGESLNGAIDKVMPVVNMATGALNFVSSTFFGSKAKSSFGIYPISATDKTFGSKDPVSTEISIRTRVYSIAERAGYVMDKIMAVEYTRNFIFTTRPTLASDSDSGLCKSYVWVTRPNCNLVTIENGLPKLVPDLAQHRSLAALIATDPHLYSELCRDGANKSNLFSLFTNYIREVPVANLSDTERPGIENMYGFSTPMSGPPERNNVEVTLNMMDNYRGDIFKLMYCMSAYRYEVSRRGYPMRDEYIKYRGDDSMVSMYVCTTNIMGEILSFGVYLNGVITSTPSHLTQHKLGGFSKTELLDSFDVTIKFATFHPYNPLYYDVFNNLFGFDPIAMIDLQGSETHLVHPGRVASEIPDGGSLIRPLFGVSLGAIDSKIGDFLGGVSDTAGKFTDILDTGLAVIKSGDIWGTAKSIFGLGTQADPDIDRKIITDSKKFSNMYEGHFEFMATSPGIYVSKSNHIADQTRQIWRLGFSTSGRK